MEIIKQRLPSATNDADGNIAVSGDVIASDLRVDALDDARVPGGFNVLPSGVGVVCFRIDDGFDDNNTASTLAATYGIPLSLAINPVAVTGTGSRLSLVQLQALVASGHEILNHGYTHSVYTGDLLEDPAVYAAEVTAAQAWFEANGIPCDGWITAGRRAGYEGPNTMAEWLSTYFGINLRRLYKHGISLGAPPFQPLPEPTRYGIAESLLVEDSSGGTAARLNQARRVINHLCDSGQSGHVYWHRTNTGTPYISSTNLSAIFRHADSLRLLGRLELLSLGAAARSMTIPTSRPNLVANGSFERMSPANYWGAATGIWTDAATGTGDGQRAWAFLEETDIHAGALIMLRNADGNQPTTTLASDSIANATTLAVADAQYFPAASAASPGMVEVQLTGGGQPYRITYTGITTGAGTEELTGCSRHPLFTATDGYTVKCVGRYPTAITATTLTCTGAFGGLSTGTKYWIRLLLGPGHGLEPVSFTTDGSSVDPDVATLDAGQSFLVDRVGAVVASTDTLFEIWEDGTSVAHTGQMYVRLKGGPAGGTTSSRVAVRLIPVRPGKRYRISWWQRSFTAAKSLQCQILTSPNYSGGSTTTVMDYTSYTNATQKVWEQFHKTIQVPATAWHMILNYRIVGAGTGPMALDDVEVVEI